MNPRIVLAMLLCAVNVAASAEGGRSASNEAKELSGMSVLGNNETPKALYIVPWKSSEIGLETDLRSGLLNDAMSPVDKEVFMRQLEFYEISAGR
ncbi:hypothetical protein SVA_1989 [Sulfurifustis variabilis]|uniref:Uncharacterized protein n=1 Tax=Sulfurifustis variabilis TaxID=1675686 RepID=A0A1B4VBZ3_9GAMM|nr:hypothetical protein [Sulfurifustis variabilis]BAU48541.1 hypothetical protein SVA_1989 [Sulfurifustis variabilis]